MKKAMSVLVSAETALATVVLIILIVLTFFGVIARYIFGSPFTWEEEAQLACMVWISFLAAPVAFHTGSHVAIEILVENFPLKVQKAVEVLVMILVWATLLYFFFKSISFISAIEKTRRTTPILRIPYKYIYGIAPVSIILMLISYTYVTAGEWLHKKEADNGKEAGNS